jgi:hypothetical protein
MCDLRASELDSLKLSQKLLCAENEQLLKALTEVRAGLNKGSI